MISKDEFISCISKARPLSEQELSEIDSQFDSAQAGAAVLENSMPGIGFFSVAKRLNTFLSVCRHLDQLVDSGEMDASTAQLSLLILRLSNSSFQKAATMFDIRGHRFDACARAEMPRSAKEYLASVDTYG